MPCHAMFTELQLEEAYVAMLIVHDLDLLL